MTDALLFILVVSAFALAANAIIGKIY